MKKYGRVFALPSPDGPASTMRFDGLEGVPRGLVDLSYGASFYGIDGLQVLVSTVCENPLRTTSRIQSRISISGHGRTTWLAWVPSSVTVRGVCSPLYVMASSLPSEVVSLLTMKYFPLGGVVAIVAVKMGTMSDER